LTKTEIIAVLYAVSISICIIAKTASITCIMHRNDANIS
jgi:hypothetical protein